MVPRRTERTRTCRQSPSVVLSARKITLSSKSRSCSLSCGRIDQSTDGRDAICRKAAPLCVLAYGCLVWSEIHAVDLVACDVALQPLNLRAHASKNGQRFARDLSEFRVRQISGSWDFSFDHKLRHVITSGMRMLA